MHQLWPWHVSQTLLIGIVIGCREMKLNVSSYYDTPDDVTFGLAINQAVHLHIHHAFAYQAQENAKENHSKAQDDTKNRA